MKSACVSCPIAESIPHSLFTAGSANTYWNAWTAGDIKHANDVKMQIMAMTVPSMVITVLYVIIPPRAMIQPNHIRRFAGPADPRGENSTLSHVR